MSESSMRSIVIEALRVHHAVAVENPVGPGTPDVNCSLGWIELKQLEHWPKIPAERPILVPLFTPQQRIWLLKRCRVDGSAYLLLKAGDDWLLFDGETAAAEVGRASKARLYEIKIEAWDSNRTLKEGLGRCLSSRRHYPRPNASPSTGVVST